MIQLGCEVDLTKLNFITMQLVHGKTLRELLPRNGFPLDKFFEIAVPLTDAVAAAHEQDITHRDLKPDNMIVSDKGQVTVLDFGLAKTRGGPDRAKSDLPTEPRTREGVIVGTVDYMSPEQAEGKQVDHRTDIFSVGIILYEMVTGQRPFQGDTSTAVLSSILKDTPRAVTDVNPALPALLERNIRRCLAKDPSRRYQTALDIRNELEELRQDVQSGDILGAARSRRVEAERRPRSGWLGAGIVAALLVIAWMGGVFRSSLEETVGSPVPRLTNPAQVTSAVGREDQPSWSPDGRAIAYHSDQSGNWDIWISQVDGGQPLNRTADHEGTDQYPSCSPDGAQIAFESDRGGGGIFVMPVFAGPPYRVSQPGTVARGRPQWSADGSELAYEVREDDRSFAEMTSLATSESRRVELPGVRTKRPHLSWSPSGRFFAYIDADEPINQSNELRIFRVGDASSVALTGADTYDLAPSWSGDERTLYFPSNRGGTRDLWRQPLGEKAEVDGDAQPVTVGLEVLSAAFSPDGTKLACSKGRMVANVWRAPTLPDRLATWADTEQLTFDRAHVSGVDVTPDGERLTFSTDRSGSIDVWILTLRNGELRQLTVDAGIEALPSWSPDGSEVAFFSNRAGTRDVWVKKVDGGPAQQITSHESEDYFPAWTPDGDSIAFGSTRGGGLTIWTVSTDGGSPTRLVDAEDVNSPRWSPDGEWLAFSSYGTHVPPSIWVMRRGEFRPESLTNGFASAHWSPDGQQILFKRATTRAGGATTQRRGADLWAVDRESRSTRQLTNLSGRPGGLGIFATDGDYLYFTWNEDVGDIWVMDVVTDESE